MSLEQQLVAQWRGRESRSHDLVTQRMADAFAATFAPHLAETLEGVAPLGIHWCLSPAIAPMDALGADGHPAKNRDLPPVPLPRRMWAGGRLDYASPIYVGDEVERITTIGDISRKQGRSGELWFVAVHHEYRTPRGLALRERHDIVYREAAGDAPAAEPPPPAGFADMVPQSWVVETHPTLLFRYSALTFNGHRIHYDLPYATGTEGYRGLVVHGPIQATLLFNMAAQMIGAPPPRFDYRGLSAAIAGTPIRVRRSSKDAAVFLTEGTDGAVHMEARIG